MTAAQEYEHAREQRYAKVTAALRSPRMLAVLAATRASHPHCTCKVRAGMTAEELRDLGSGCAARFVCPRLDRVRRAAGL